MSEPLDSNSITELVTKYRNGDLKAAKRLLEVFKPLLGRFINLIVNRKYNTEDSNIMKLISNVCKPKRISVLQLKNILYFYSADYLVNICKIALLKTADRYYNISKNYVKVLSGYILDHIDKPINLEFDSTHLIESLNINLIYSYVNSKHAIEKFNLFETNIIKNRLIDSNLNKEVLVNLASKTWSINYDKSIQTGKNFYAITSRHI